MISYKSVDEIIRTIVLSATDKKPVRLIYDAKLDVLGDTNCYDYDDGILVRIQCPKKFVNPTTQQVQKGFMTNQKFCVMVITAYHETKHILQNIDYLSKTKSEIINKMAIEEFAHWQSPDYYNLTYKSNICEIDAEKYALINAKPLLEYYVGSVKAEKLILKYINRKVENKNYFNLAHQNSLDSAVTLLHDCFVANLNHLDLFRYPQDYNNKIGQDAFYDSLFNRSGRDVDLQYDKITDGWNQRKFMVYIAYKYNTVNRYITENHILYTAPWLKDSSLLIDKSLNISHETDNIITPNNSTKEYIPNMENLHDWLHKTQQDIEKRRTSKSLNFDINKSDDGQPSL